jgi:hypothetical protein
VPAPSIDPEDLDPTEIPPADSYRPADPVWVYRAGAWHAGVVVATSSRTATVTYRPAQGPETAIDTLAASYLSPRADLDPLLDDGGAFPPSAGRATGQTIGQVTGQAAAGHDPPAGQDATAGP